MLENGQFCPHCINWYNTAQQERKVPQLVWEQCRRKNSTQPRMEAQLVGHQTCGTVTKLPELSQLMALGDSEKSKLWPDLLHLPQIKNNEMGGTCRMYGGEERHI